MDKLAIPVLTLILAAVFISSVAVAEDNSKVQKGVYEQMNEVGGDTIKIIVRTKEVESEDITKEKIVGKLNNTELGSKVAAILTLRDIGEIRNRFSNVPAVSMEIPKENLDLLASQEFVEKIEPVYEVHALIQESVPLIGATKVWSQVTASENVTGIGVSVCVLDTGVDYNHPDLNGRVVSGYDFVNNDDDPIDDHGHGTWVAGIIGANGGLKGVGPNITIIPIKVLDASGGGDFGGIMAGIDWCISNATKFNISVISMSLGTDNPFLFDDYCDIFGNSTISDLVNIAVSNNISVVAATGNNYNTTHIAFPACIQNVISVGATYDFGPVDQVTDFSNRNNITDILAPGSKITSTYLSGLYATFNGTSASTPHVSGVLALMYQKYRLFFGTNPNVTYLVDILKDTGVPVTDVAGSGLTFPRIDALAAVNKVAPIKYTQSVTEIIRVAEGNGKHLNMTQHNFSKEVSDNIDFSEVAEASASNLPYEVGQSIEDGLKIRDLVTVVVFETPKEPAPSSGSGGGGGGTFTVATAAPAPSTTVAEVSRNAEVQISEPETGEPEQNVTEKTEPTTDSEELPATEANPITGFFLANPAAQTAAAVAIAAVVSVAVIVCKRVQTAF